MYGGFLKYIELMFCDRIVGFTFGSPSFFFRAPGCGPG
ncbi:MAG: hypothetical protein ACI956_002141 [Nonlabens sp.]